MLTRYDTHDSINMTPGFQWFRLDLCLYLYLQKERTVEPSCPLNIFLGVADARARFIVPLVSKPHIYI